MGAVVAKLIFKNGQETVSSNYASLWEIGAKNIDGDMIDPLLKVVEGKKCVMVVNVATN